MKQTSLSGYVISEEPKFLLATSPPTMMQRRLALGVTATLLLIFALTAPFATIQLPRIDAFIPILQILFFVNDLITAVMLFSQFSCSRSLAILMLASGYLFASFIVVAHTLTFPGLFSPTGLLGAGPQSTAWLYFFWHLGFAAAVLLFACTKDNAPNSAAGCHSGARPAVHRFH